MTDASQDDGARRVVSRRLPLFSGEPPTEMVSHVGSLISAVIAATFVASVLYDWGFLSALGLGFEDLPTTLSDHTRSALLWLPAMSASVFVCYTMELFTQRMDNGRMAHEMPPPRGCVMAFYVVGPFWLVLAFGPVFFVLFGEVAAGLALGSVAAIWLRFAYWIVTHHVVGARMSWVARRAFYYVPSVALVIFAAGYQIGVYRLIDARGQAVLAGQAEPVGVLRVYESGLLYRDDDKTGFQRWDTSASMIVPARRAIWLGVYRRPNVRRTEAS